MQNKNEQNNKKVRKRINKIREAQAIITKEINSLYNDISEFEDSNTTKHEVTQK